MSSATSLSNDLANSSDLSNSPPNNQAKRKLFSIDSILSNGCNLKETEVEVEEEEEILNLKLMKKKSNHSVVAAAASSSSSTPHNMNTNPYEQLFLQNIQNSSNFFKNCFLNQSTVALINAAATNNLDYQQQQQQKQNNFNLNVNNLIQNYLHSSSSSSSSSSLSESPRSFSCSSFSLSPLVFLVVLRFINGIKTLEEKNVLHAEAAESSYLSNSKSSNKSKLSMFSGKSAWPLFSM